MSPANLEQYLSENIPLSKAMQVSVLEIREDAVVLSAPLTPNINHRETVFGGSASALAILAAWGLLHVRLNDAGTVYRLVIQRNTMEYLFPIHGRFTARSSLPEPESWNRFQRILKRRGKARTTVTSVLEHGGRAVGRFAGEFVAMSGAPLAVPRTS